MTRAGFSDIRLDATVLTFSLVLCLLASVLSGLLPALRASRVQPRTVLSDGAWGATGGPRSLRFQGILVIAEIAIAVVLLIGSALMIQSLNNLRSVDPGFRAENVLTVPIELPGFRYTPDHGLVFMRELERRTAELPGVVSAALTNDVPLQQLDPPVPFIIDGAPLPQPGSEPTANPHLVSASYFRTMEIPIVQGARSTSRTSRGRRAW